MLSDRGVRTGPRLRPRFAVVQEVERVLREVGLTPAVRGMPHTVCVNLYVARHLARGRKGALCCKRRISREPPCDEERCTDASGGVTPPSRPPCGGRGARRSDTAAWRWVVGACRAGIRLRRLFCRCRACRAVSAP